MGKVLLGDPDHQGEAECPEEGFNHELPSQYEPGDHQQAAVDHQDGDPDRNTGRVVDQHGDSRQSSRHDLVGYQKAGESDGVKHQTNDYQQVIAPLKRLQIFLRRQAHQYQMTTFTILRGTMITFFGAFPSSHFCDWGCSSTTFSISALVASAPNSSTKRDFPLNEMA